MAELEHLLPANNKLGEGPIWSVGEQCLYWVDIEDCTFSRLQTTTNQLEVFRVGVPVGVLAQRASGGLVLATHNGFALWDSDAQELRYLPDNGVKPAPRTLNDGAVDCNGRFWVGSKARNEQNLDGTLYRLDGDGSIHVMVTGIGISNGIGWSPDNTRMYHTDSSARAIYVYDFDLASGTIENRRYFVHTPGEVAQPDGLTVDAEGCVWSCYWDGAKVVRYDPTGKIERVIPLPVLRPTSCVFGGEHLDELYITSASTGLTPEQRLQYPLSGDLFRLKTDVKGQESYVFAG